MKFSAIFSLTLVLFMSTIRPISLALNRLRAMESRAIPASEL